MTPTGISNLVAAELSQAAYDTLEPANLPPGWTDDLSDYVSSNGNSFSTFVNTSTQQVVIVFRGTTTLAQLESDVSDQGGAEWEAIKGEFASVLASVQAALPGYQIMTDGHSLGGGMAQTAALEFGLSGYGQNALPISPDAVADINNNAGGLDAALAAWQANGNTFSEATVAGDITTIAFAGDLDLYTNATTSPNTSTTTLSNIYAGLEKDGLAISLEGNSAKGAAVVALAEEAAHGIGNVIAELQGAGAVATVPVAFLLTDKSDLNAIGGGFDIADSAALISAGFKALEADASHIQSISFTDAGTPTLVLTPAEAAADASLLPKISGSYDVDVVGVTGEPYSAYEQDYVDGLFQGAQYFSAAPAHASYSLVAGDENHLGAYIGETRFTADITGESFTGKAVHYDAMGERRSKTLTGITGQSYTSITYDYTKSGASAGVTQHVTDAPGESYLVGNFHYDADGALRWESAELENGGFQITGEANGVQLAGQGNDVMTGGGSRETFSLGPIFGADSITDFSSHDHGGRHDTISLSRSDFANFSAVLSSASNSGGDVLIAGPNGQTLTLDGLDVAQLAHLSADFTFHGKR